MQIVVLDGYTLNPGDLNWQGLELYGDLVVYDRTPADKIYQRAKDAEVVLTNKTPLNRELIKQLPQLRYIGVLATGYNVVDVSAAKQQGIVVTNIPAYGTSSVAQMVFALLLELCHHVELHSNAVRQGEWSQSADFCFWKTPLIELAGKTLGIIGFGRIGRQVAAIAAGFGMRILAYDTNQTNAPKLTDFAWCEIDDLLAQSDVVSLHCPLLSDNQGLINQTTLAKMKPSAFLINTSRGGLIVDQDLAASLNQEQIAGAGLDVLSMTEPPAADNPLLTAKNCIITPHIAWATKDARERLMNTAISNLAAFVAGAAVNDVTSSM